MNKDNNETEAQEKLKRFEMLLNEEHDWPCLYLFKFICPTYMADQVRLVSGISDFEVKASKNAAFVSLTKRLEMKNAKEILKIYREVSALSGVIIL